MKLTVIPLERSSRARRHGLHYHICVRVDVLSKHVPTLVQYLVGQTTHLVGHCPIPYRYFPHCSVRNIMRCLYLWNSTVGEHVIKVYGTFITFL